MLASVSQGSVLDQADTMFAGRDLQTSEIFWATLALGAFQGDSKPYFMYWEDVDPDPNRIMPFFPEPNSLEVPLYGASNDGEYAAIFYEVYRDWQATGLPVEPIEWIEAHEILHTAGDGLDHDNSGPNIMNENPELWEDLANTTRLTDDHKATLRSLTQW